MRSGLDREVTVRTRSTTEPIAQVLEATVAAAPALLEISHHLPKNIGDPARTGILHLLLPCFELVSADALNARALG